MKKVLLSLLGGLISVYAFSQLNGTYTINGAQATGGTNYQTFSAAFSALTASGVSGPVTFNCVQGTYTEQVYLSFASIAGTSATNTITFQPDASNTSEVLWTHSSSPLYLYYCTLNNIKFTGLHFKTTGTYNACIYMYMGTFTNVTFEGNIIDGAQTNSTSSSYAAVCSYYTTQNNFKVLDNTINYGSNSVSAYYSNYGSSSTAEVTISNNIMQDYYYAGAYCYGYYSPYTKFVVKDNYIRNNATSGYTYPYGVYCYYPKEGSELSGNDIELNAASGGYGMLCNYAYGTSTNPVLVYNNMVNLVNASAPYNQYGISASYNTYAKIHHNTFRITNNYDYSYGAYLYYSSTSYMGNEFKNNIVYGGQSNAHVIYGYYMGSSSGTMDFSNNAYYQDGGYFKVYNGYTGGTYTDLSAWQTASGSDANSVHTDPLFISASNLTPQSATINNNGTPLGITTDIFGNTRSALLPDPGAIEFTVPTNNAQPHELISPAAPLCADDTSFIAVIKNTGLVNLTSLTLNYLITGSSAQTMSWTGNLAPQALDTVVIMASTSYDDGDHVQFWTSLPNGVSDSASLFDTIHLDLFDGLNGTYSIPGDYATITDARNDLVAKGVCGHVVFNIAPGTYNEQVTFPYIVGSSANATITFQSSTANASDVTISYASTSTADNYIIKLDGADWFTFNELKLQNTGTYLYATVFSLSNGASNNTITDCWIMSNYYQYTGAGNYMTGIYIYGAGNDNNTITNNQIEAGNCGLYCYGGGTTSRNNGLTVENNRFEDSWFYNAYIYYTDNVEFNNNVITNDTAMYYYGYALMMGYVNGFNITGNYIGTDISGGYYYGMYLYSVIGNNNPRSQIANNCIYAGAANSTSYGYYGVYSSSSGIYDFVYNSVNKRGSSSYYAGYFSSGGLITLKNNSFANYNTGYALAFGDAFTVAESDNNNLYTVGGAEFYFAGAAYQDLAAWQQATGFDLNSVQTNPAWQTTLTCVTCNDTLNNSGAVLAAVTTDIDGNPRSYSTPDIGASEYVTPATFSLGADDTICGNEAIVEAGPAQSVVWSVNTVPYTTPSVILNASTAPVNFDISVVIATEYCGSASDDVLIRLVPDASLDSSAHICADEDVTLQPGGGANATYLWSNGETTASITVNEAGAYSVTKMEEGCESSATIAVTKSDAVEILDVEPCSDELPVSLDATIASGTSYAWSGGTSINTAVNSFNDAGNYSVTATDSYGCTSSDEFSVVVLETPEASIDENHSGLIYFFDASNSLYISSNTTYFWDFGYNGLTGTNVTESVQYPWSDPSNPVTYTVTLTVDNGCGNSMEVMEITPDPLGIDELKEGAFVLYPNPAQESVRFALGSAAADQGLVEILDITGRVVVSESIAAGTSTGEINISNIATGSYMVRITLDGHKAVNTLIKQ